MLHRTATTDTLPVAPTQTFPTQHKTSNKKLISYSTHCTVDIVEWPLFTISCQHRSTARLVLVSLLLRGFRAAGTLLLLLLPSRLECCQCMVHMFEHIHLAVEAQQTHTSSIKHKRLTTCSMHTWTSRLWGMRVRRCVTHTVHMTRVCECGCLNRGWEGGMEAGSSSVSLNAEHLAHTCPAEQAMQPKQ